MEIRFGAALVLGNLERDLQYNHLLKNFVCLAFVAAACNESFAARALRSVRASVQQQFLPDGGQAERSPMYHLLSLLDLRILRDSGALAPEVEAYVSRTAAKAENAARAMVHPDGDVALFNDSWIGEAPRAADMINGLDLRPEEPLAAELPETGYVRLAQNGDGIVLDFGACGPDDNPGHAHADFLSLELSVGGEKAVVDAGVPTYSEGELRDGSRSASWHNGPMLEGAEPIEFWSSFRVGRRGYAHKLALPARSARELTFAAWQSGYAHVGGVVARAVRLMPGRGLLIADVWAGAGDRAAALHFLIGEKWPWLDGTRFAGTDAAQGMLMRFNSLEGELRDVQTASYWERFGAKRCGKRVILAPARDGKLRVAGLWVDWGGKAEDIAGHWLALRGDMIEAFRALPVVAKLIQ